MTDTTPAEREAFEEWVRSTFATASKLLTPGEGRWTYADSVTLFMWQAWQARAASQPADELIASMKRDLAKFMDIDNTDCGVNWFISRVRWHLDRAASQPAKLTAQQLDVLIERHCGGTELTDGEYSSMVMFAASVERAHGIGAEVRATAIPLD